MIKPRDFHEALGQAIRERRERIEMSREKLGSIVGRDADYITSIEDGDAQLDLYQMLLISRFLNVRLSALFAIVELRLFED